MFEVYRAIVVFLFFRLCPCIAPRATCGQEMYYYREKRRPLIANVSIKATETGLEWCILRAKKVGNVL